MHVQVPQSDFMPFSKLSLPSNPLYDLLVFLLPFGICSFYMTLCLSLVFCSLRQLTPCQTIYEVPEPIVKRNHAAHGKHPHVKALTPRIVNLVMGCITPFDSMKLCLSESFVMPLGFICMTAAANAPWDFLYGYTSMLLHWDGCHLDAGWAMTSRSSLGPSEADTSSWPFGIGNQLTFNSHPSLLLPAICSSIDY